PAVHAGEAERDAGAVAVGLLHALEGELEDEFGFDHADWAAPVDGVARDPGVDASDFFVGEAGIGLREGDELAFAGSGAGPDGKGVIGEERRAFAAAPLRVDE